MDRWQDRIALVTGASSGIGRAVALALVEAGMRVAVTARRTERLKELVETCGADRVIALPADFHQEEQILEVFRRIDQAWGSLHVLINNAGFGRSAPLMSGSTQAWRSMLDVNVLALCICTREAVRRMRADGDRGHILHISSMAAHRVPSGSGVYSATKFAVRSLTEGLRLELHTCQSAIRVSAISPGFVETEFAQTYHGDPEVARRIYDAYPMVQPEDIARTVLHVLSLPEHVQVHDVLVRPTRQPS
jgi:NADP-dependent 3-hydroxy acid dehydrogenase YdfG